MAKLDLQKREEFAKCAVPHMDDVYAAGLYLTRSEDEAAELLQETYLRAYRFWHQFTLGTNCKAWLLTILHNVFRTRFRERQHAHQQVEFDETVHHPESVGDTGSNPEELVLARLLEGEVEEALRTLPIEFREVCILIDLQDLTYQEAAAALNCPIGTIRSRLSRARRQLQHALREYAKAHGIRRRDSYALR